MKARTLILAAVALLMGCSGSPRPEGGAPKDASGDSAPSPQAKEVPAELQNEAYHWYGLDNQKPTEMTVKFPDGQKFEGEQTVKLDSVEDGKATFTIDRTEGLETVFGDEKLSLEKDGIFTVSSTKLKGNPRSIELPAGVKVGTTWKSSSKLETSDDKAMAQNQTYTAKGIVPVKTASGTEQALKVVCVGTAKIDGTAFTMETRSWYVRDKGLVKAEISMTKKGPNAKPQTITIETNK